MNKDEKRRAFERAIGSALMVLVGVLLVCKPDLGPAAVGTVVGWVLVAAGGLGLLICILNWPYLGVPELALCALGLGVGIYLLCEPMMLAKILGFALGAWLVIQGAVMLRDGVRARQAGAETSAALVLGAVMLATGVVLVFCPLATSRVITILAGVALIVYGAVKLVVEARTAKFLREHPPKSKIIDADE